MTHNDTGGNDSDGVELCSDCGRGFENLSVHHGMTECGPDSFKKELECEVCGETFEKYKCHIGRSKGEGKYCSKGCQAKGTQTGEARECKWCGGEYYRPDCHLNRERGGENHGRFCSPECHIEWRVDTGEFRGANHPAYKGGHRITSIVRTLLSDEPWTTVRADYRGDKEICENCGARTTRKLDVHHIIPVASGGVNEPELLMNLCRSCHFKADRFIEQYTEPHLLKYAED